MSILDSRVIYTSNQNFQMILSGSPGLTYKIKDIPGEPEYTWDGSKFIKSITQGRNEILTIQDAIISNSTAQNLTGSWGNGNSNTTIESTGFLKLNENARYWRDIDFPLSLEPQAQVSQPYKHYKEILRPPQWQVNDYNVCEGQELVHEYLEGGNLNWHCHLITNGVDTTDRYTKWEVEWVWANPGGVISNTTITTSQDILIPANTPSKTHILAQIASTPIQGTIGGHVYARLKRVASTGTAPTLNPWCTMLQAHILCDTMGSRGISDK